MPSPKDKIRREGWIRKLSESHKGKYHSPKTRRKMSLAHRGKPLLKLRGKHNSPSTEFKKGFKMPKKWREKIKEKIRRGKKCNLWRGGKTIKRICPNCKKEVWFYPTKVRVFCSLKCYYEYLEKQPIISRFNRGYFWKQIRKRVLMRDNYTCQICGKKEGLHIHHMVPYREKEDNSDKNLITLCINCHMKKDFGRGSIMRKA